MKNNLGNHAGYEEYATFMSEMRVGFCKLAYDGDLTVVWANDAFYGLSGYSREEYGNVFHGHLNEQCCGDESEISKVVQTVADAFKRGLPGFEFECAARGKGGEKLRLRVTGRAANEECDGKTVYSAVLTDITALVPDVFRQESADDKSKILSHISHDIRTPMNAIIGMTSIAGAHLDSAERVGDCLNKISFASQNLLSLLSDMLDMSQIENNSLIFSREPVVLPDLLENIMGALQPEFSANNQYFYVRLHNVSHEQFYCDPVRLRQVFIHLLSNMARLTQDGGMMKLDVEECESDSKGTANFRFVFSTSSSEVSQAILDRIFSPFGLEEDNRSEKSEGSGLSLALAKMVMELMGGSVEAQRLESGGFSFLVFLPLQLNDTMTDDIRFPNLKVMIVSCDDSMCKFTENLLEQLGAFSEWVNTGADAVSQIVQAHQTGDDYDAVILDWQAIDMGGMEVAGMIREQIGDKLPIIIETVFDWEDIEEEATSVGVNGYLSKPVFRSSLCRALQKYVLGQLPDQPDLQDFDFSGKRFLLVEDNELNREIAIEFLASTGVEVDIACDGEQGVEKFMQSEEGYYDLILMDIQMPKKDGYAATREIRALPRRDSREIPILATTANAFTEDVLAAKEAGMDEHLAKPLDVLGMNLKISEFLRKRSGF